MDQKYNVKIISEDQKERIMKEIYASNLYERKAMIHGTCLKFFTDSLDFKGMWEENFEPMPDYIRPHARLFVVKRKGKQLSVLYEPVSKTVIVYNCDYYGWVKSIALALVADFFEDFISEHRRYSIHGSFIDNDGTGIAIVGPSGSGKTTLTYGLLMDKQYHFVTDDWFFVRMVDGDVLVYSSEKNSYIRSDLAETWPLFRKKLKGIKCDRQSRAIIDVQRFFGETRIRNNSVMRVFVLLTRDRKMPPVRKLSAAEAVSFMEKNDFCNPHQLIRTRKKRIKRVRFFRELFSKVPVYLLNTIETPEQSLDRIKKLL